MKYYTRTEVTQILEVEDGFVIALEREEIITRDAPEKDSGEYSDVMLERVRVASNLVQDLEVNLPGVAIILHMREQLADQRHRIDHFVLALQRQGES